MTLRTPSTLAIEGVHNRAQPGGSLYDPVAAAVKVAVDAVELTACSSNVLQMSLDDAQRVLASVAKSEGQRLYRKLLGYGKSPAEAIALASPLLFYDDPDAMSHAAALIAATTPPPKSNLKSGAPEVDGGKTIVGTGFFVTDDGYLVTCEHIVRQATSFRVRLPARSVAAQLVTADRKLDLALLKVSGAFSALPVPSEAHVSLGDPVFTIGFPNPDVQGVEPKLTKGEISSLAGMGDNPRYFQISVPIQPGNSGGALVDEGGNVVGVVTARLDDLETYQISGALPQNVNYAVKGSSVRAFLDGVPGLFGKLKSASTAAGREIVTTAAQRASVLVIAELESRTRNESSSGNSTGGN
jgi:S1-C subfamily serine protease